MGNERHGQGVLCELRRKASKDNKVRLMPKMEDSRLRPLWRLTHARVKV